MDASEYLKLKGWEFLEGDKVREQKGKGKASGYALDRLAFETFSTPAGKKFLAQMVQQTLLRPTVRPESTQFAVGIREGQNDLVRQILTMIERSKKGPL